ncbi:MAG: hypothetical protein AB7I27_03095 [Bacteriovoracaceae bacterium]
MENMSLRKSTISLMLVMMIIITGCMPSDAPTANRQNYNALPGDNVGSGSGATGTGDITSGTSLLPKVEIRHLIEPNLSTDTSYSSGTGYAGGGSYVRKLTLPKNFEGKLYLAGINIGTLASNFVRVRFKFGISREPVIVSATVTKAPGITPATPISVLVMDLRSQPFRNVRLPYDLFDYNEYDFTAGDTPTQDNRDSGLYCRGLQVQDDPTFVGVGACDGLQSNSNQPEEECLYAYAKVLDQGLVKESNGVKVPITPTLPQSKSISGSNYYQDYLTAQLKKPLLDTMPTSSSYVVGSYKFSELSTGGTDSTNITYTYSAMTPTSIWDAISINGVNHYYRGPYRLVNKSQWQFAFSDLDGPKKLFKSNSWVYYTGATPLPDDSQTSPTQTKLYYNSYLFPLATKLDLAAGVSHLSSSSVDGVRSETTLASAGKTLWMDGANARAVSKNADQEHIGSCNVVATIEILAKDSNGTEYVVATSRDVKLQLVRPTQYRTDTGNEVLYSNFKTCSTNAGCGSSECCFNNRCWDQSLVSQCFDSSSTQGNKVVGDSCSTDLECSSLCCNRTSGQCAPHNTSLNPAVLCSKPIGDYCISKEWCQKTPITKCLVVKTGTDSLGNTTCRQQCYVVEEFGDCKNSACVPPTQDPIPTFDPSSPTACDGAVTAPNF